MLLMSTVAAVVLIGAPAQVSVPDTPVKPVTETLHGEEITDNYRWLESLEADSEEVRNWTDAQLAYTRSVLDDLPGREALEKKLEELLKLPVVGAPRMAGDRYFHTERTGDQNQSVLYWQVGHDGENQVLIDPNELDPSGLTSLDWYSPNQDGSRLAFGLSEAGDENSTLHVLEVDTGRWLADEIDGKVRGVDWMPDGRSFFYENLEDIDDPYSARIRYHELGDHPREDRLVFSQYTEGPLATTWGPFASASDDGRWLLIGYWTSTKANDLWVADLNHWMRTGELNLHTIIEGEDATSFGTVFGDHLYMQTTHEAPNGRIVKINLHDLSREVIIDERPDAVLESMDMARGMLVTTYTMNASTRIEQFTLDGEPLGGVQLPGIGSASIITNDDRTEAFLSYTSFNDPGSIWRLDLANADERALWSRREVPFDPDSITVKQVWYPSRDGTSVSMFIVHRKGLSLDGNNPTLLTGYGGFNISMTPYFSSSRIPWLEGGGVIAIPNLRGGGEYGRKWHEGGMLANKQNTFDDFIAAAEYLIDQQYTSRDHLAVLGGSNGGLLIGAVVTQRPDLFSAAISAVPLLDMLRYPDFLMAKSWVPEYGDPNDPEQFKWLREYSPYHNIEDGVEYPAMLFTAGENDTRVHPMHARKMAAAMQAAASNDFDSEPIMLWVTRESGHGGGKPLRLQIQETADLWSFMMWQTGMSMN